MYKWLAVIVAIYLIGDPILENISSVITVGEMNELLLTGVISLFLIPWVSAQFDN
jgi:preprotein translocase subunit SecF